MNDINLKYLALEIFHVFHINHLHYDHQHKSWMVDIPGSKAKGQVNDELILYSASLVLSGITKQRIDTLLAQQLITQIKAWSIASQGQSLNTFNPDLGSFRFIPQCLCRT